ncbi:hypothetical protein MNBD_GAMMA21-2779 [hydrothermal vent metagenome]|uniref:Glutaredoxin domain-containing protein n=1 Tax=hydrothermal vent metagenome TaxID=652676 RepID=A0A3B0ZWF9_9ZZZZ
MANVVMYCTRFCPYCVRAKDLLEHKGIEYDEISVDSDRVKRQEMMQLSGRTSVPQIFIGEDHIGGCDDLYALDAAGGLDTKLGLA